MAVDRDMTVKSVRGRRRYTAFEVPRGTDRRDVESTVGIIDSVKVITCKDGLAVVRSLPEDRRSIEEAMSSRFKDCRSLDCSGTLKALRDRDPRLRSPRRRKR